MSWLPQSPPDGGDSPLVNAGAKGGFAAKIYSPSLPLSRELMSSSILAP